MPKHPAAVALGRLGGSAKSSRKAQSSRENGKKGGRPKKVQPCPVAVVSPRNCGTRSV